MHSKDLRSNRPIFEKDAAGKSGAKSIKQVLREIEVRPAMYLGRNSLICLRSYLDGWSARGLELGFEDEDSILEEFHAWVEDRFDMKDTASWDRIIICFSQDDADALVRFFRLFREFLEEV